MNRRAVDKLRDRVEQIRQRFSPAVSILLHGEDGYRLTCNAGTSGWGMLTSETTHATETEAHATYERFLQAHSTTSENATLIIIDV